MKEPCLTITAEKHNHEYIGEIVFQDFSLFYAGETIQELKYNMSLAIYYLKQSLKDAKRPIPRKLQNPKLTVLLRM